MSIDIRTKAKISVLISKNLFVNSENSKKLYYQKIIFCFGNEKWIYIFDRSRKIIKNKL